MFGKKIKIKIITVTSTVILLLGSKTFFHPPRIVIDGVTNSLCPGSISYFDTKDPLIALTIDDSPDDNHSFPHTTLGILDVLATYNVRATFFVITNKAKQYPQLLKTIVQQGHELGNHLTNDEASIKLGDRFETEFIKADRFLTQFAIINWFRPGHGRCDRQMTAIARKYNYQIALGSICSYDTNKLPKWFSSWYILRNIRPGAIIVLHDSDNKSDRRGKNTIQTLTKIIPQLQKQGYRFVTLSELDRLSD